MFAGKVHVRYAWDATKGHEIVVPTMQGYVVAISM